MDNTDTPTFNHEWISQSYYPAFRSSRSYWCHYYHYFFSIDRRSFFNRSFLLCQRGFSLDHSARTPGTTITRISPLPPFLIHNRTQVEMRQPLTAGDWKGRSRTTVSFHRTKFLQVDKCIFALVLRIQKFSPHSL